MHIIELEETGSTNDDAKRLAIDGAPHLTVVWAHSQTSGRGRHGRTWISTTGNLYWSIVLRTGSNWPRLSDIVYVNALAVQETLDSLTGRSKAFRIKWPNDMLLNERKVAGSLLEGGGRFRDGRPDWIIVGTGINIVSHPGTADALYPPTSLHAEGCVDLTREQIVAPLQRTLANMIDMWLANPFSVISERYMTFAHNLNNTIRVSVDADRSRFVEGVYRGLDAEGSLLLETEDGELRAFAAADIIAATGRG